MQCLVIGLGSAGKRHSEILKALPIVHEVHAVTQQTDFAIKTYRSIAEAGETNHYDYVVIASATAEHKKQLKAVLRYTKPQKILVEKPLFHCYNRGVRDHSNVFVGYNLRFHAAVTKLRAVLQTAGEVYSASFVVGQYLPDWRPGREYNKNYSASEKQGGGVLLDLSHEIDLLHYLFGEIRKVTGLRTKRSNLDIDSEDIAILAGITRQNVVFTVNLDYLSFRPMRNITIQTAVNTIQVDLLNNAFIITGKGCEPNSIQLSPIDRDETYKLMHESILVRGAKDVCTMREGLRINYWVDQLKKKSIVRRAA